ncbi:MAG: hypothetical protein H0T76_21335 [Nannocystis sp.]|nr:hypothetical protein [Nannocystis sp.]MBA3549035.1 hypothetical protein [Nannocystis sp.]
MGIILYEMITRRRLFDDRAGGFRQIDSGEFAPELAQVVNEVRRGSQLVPKDRHASMDELVRGLEIARSSVTRSRTAAQGRMSRWLLRGLSGANVVALIALFSYLVAGSALPGPAPAPAPLAATKAQEKPASLAPPETPAPAAELELVGPAAASPGPPRKADAPAIVSAPKGTRKLSPALVSEAVEAARKEIGKCLESPGKLNLEIMVESGRARLTRVEWAAYNPKNGAQNYLARTLKAIEFPRNGPPGPYRLQIGE